MSLLDTQFKDFFFLENIDMGNYKTVNCLFNPQLVSRTFLILITIEAVFHVGLIDFILVKII